MPVRLVRETVVLYRPDAKEADANGRVTPEIGKNFNFTEEEVAEIKAARPQAIGKKDAEAETDKTSAAVEKTAPAKTAEKGAKEDEL